MDITENNRGGQPLPDPAALTVAESSDTATTTVEPLPVSTRPMPRLQIMPYFQLLGQAWHYGAGARWQLVAFYLLYIPAVGFSLVQPYTFGQTINALQVTRCPGWY